MDCYLHGYVSSRIMRLAKSSSAPDGKGLPVCIAATKVDGLVLALTPNSHSYNYRSAILHGYAALVEDQAEKVWAMQLITNSVMPERWNHSRIPPDGAEMQSTNILRVKVVAGSGKIRDGGPHDDKKDTEREDVTSRTWVGVVPVMEKLGEPVAASTNRVAEVPGYIRGYIQERNEEGEEYAGKAARLP
jgi:nitroimidazol reductase NimA-like FMN-containing flavoprotein (pyridoxamine 5'-phosphate oxidase superfamily)